MGRLTDSHPKSLTVVGGTTLLERALECAYQVAGPDNVIVVGGYKSEMLLKYHSKIVVNDRWDSTNIMGSLMTLDDVLLREDCTIVYSDILFEERDLRAVFNSPTPALLSVANWRDIWSSRFEYPLSDLERFTISKTGYLIRIGGRAQSLEEIDGQFAGIFKLSPSAWADLIGDMSEALVDLDSTSALMRLIELGHNFRPIESVGAWFEFDSESDLRTFSALESRGNDCT